MVTLDDVAERGLRVVVHLLVRDPDALLVRQARGGVVQQQFQDVVAPLPLHISHPGDGPEDPDPGDSRGKPVKDAQRDGRLAGVPLGGSYIDRGHRRQRRIGHTPKPAC